MNGLILGEWMVSFSSVGCFLRCISASLAQCISIKEAADKDAVASAVNRFKSSSFSFSTDSQCSAASCRRWHSTSANIVNPGRSAPDALRRRANRPSASSIKAKSRVVKRSRSLPAKRWASRRSSCRWARSQSIVSVHRKMASSRLSDVPNQFHPLAICPSAFRARSISRLVKVLATSPLFKAFKLPRNALLSEISSSQGSVELGGRSRVDLNQKQQKNDS